MAMNDTHDDLDARLEEIHSRHNSTWDDYDRDDIASAAMMRGFEAAAEKRKKQGSNVIRLPPRRPQKTLVQMLQETFAEEAERLRLEQFEADLTKHVREINYRRLLDVLDIEEDGTPKRH